MKNKIESIEQLKFDEHNFNDHTPEGKELIKKSLERNGFGRSVVVDKNNNLIGGNGVVEMARELGKKKVIFVETEGEELVVVRRNDLDINSKDGRDMALADNATAHADLNWNNEELKKAREEWDLQPEDWGVELEKSISPDDFGETFNLTNEEKKPFQQMTFTLANAQVELIKAAILNAKHTPGFKEIETFGNENNNGNALFYIIKQWEEQRK